MKAPKNIAKEAQKASLPLEKGIRTEGGNAHFMDHRPSEITQRKLRTGIEEHALNEQPFQLVKAMQSTSKTTTFPAQRKANEGSPAKSKSNLPTNLKSGVENLSGFAMDDVKVHYNSAKPAQLQAHAFAQGTDIHLAPGQEKHLPHEAWHVVQQKQGRVKPTRQLKSKVAINDDAGLEKEADVMGAKAIHAGETTQRKKILEGGGQGAGVVQRVPLDEEAVLVRLVAHLARVLAMAEGKRDEVDNTDLSELKTDVGALNELNLPGITDRVKVYDDMLNKHADSLSQVNELSRVLEYFVDKHKSLIQKINNKRVLLNNQEAPEGQDDAIKALALLAKGNQEDAAGLKLDIGLRRISALRERTVHIEHQAAFPGGKIFIPVSGQTNMVTFISHGDHNSFKGTDQATFPAPPGLSMEYMVPHGYDAQASLVYPWETDNGRVGNFHDFPAGPQGRRFKELRWYDYTLTTEGRHTGDEMEISAQKIADERGVTVIIINQPTRTSALVPTMVKLGYSSIYPIHCRGEDGDNRPEWAPVAQEGLTRPEFGRQDLLDTRANILGNYDARKGKNWVIPSATLLNNDNFYNGEAAEISTQTLQRGLAINDMAKACHYRVTAILNGNTYLRSIPSDEFYLLSFNLADEQEYADSNAERAANLETAAKQRILQRRHNWLDGQEEYLPGKFKGDYVTYR